MVDPHQSNLTEGIASITAPTPLLRFVDQSAVYGIPVHVA
jgi:hypothetical protein